MHESLAITVKTHPSYDMSFTARSSLRIKRESKVLEREGPAICTQCMASSEKYRRKYVINCKMIPSEDIETRFEGSAHAHAPLCYYFRAPGKLKFKTSDQIKFGLV